MLSAYMRRGLLAGLVAGFAAGLLGLLLGEPVLDVAIAREAAASGAQADTYPRAVQKAGLVLGTSLLGIGVGALFGAAAAWAHGRLRGDGWQRSLKLGAALVGAVVLLPALAYPPALPGTGDPATVRARTWLYLGTAATGLLLTGAGRWLALALVDVDLGAPVRHVLVAAAVGAAAASLLVVLPPVGLESQAPAELLWRFRLSSLATQAVLWGGTAVVFGLLSPATDRTSAAA